MNNKNKSSLVGKSERGLKTTAVLLSIMFALLMLYPLVFAISSAMKDNSKIYEVPPKLLPGQANSLAVVLDYSAEMNSLNDDELLDTMLRDSILVMFGLSSKMKDDSIMEIEVFGQAGDTILFHSRSHQMKLQMEKDYGIYKGTAIKKEVLLHEYRYRIASESIGYKYDAEGLQNININKDENTLTEKATAILSDKFQTSGALSSVTNHVSYRLNFESFKYYLQMPAYIYRGNETIQRFGFMTFVMNSVIVIGFAMIAQMILCSVCAFVISKKLSRRAGKFVLLFFLGGMIIPVASVMLPQLIMYKQMGAYNNYAALLLPFLYPFGFYVYLYKGFFDQIPFSYFEAGELDGAGSIYLYSKICMPLSKPIIALIALQTFIGNWNDFFWAWLVTEDQRLWTLNVASYNISNNVATKQNAIMGLSVITITPVLILSVLFSKQLKKSIISSGVKG